jgi:hypothetical protein
MHMKSDEEVKPLVKKSTISEEVGKTNPRGKPEQRLRRQLS